MLGAVVVGGTYMATGMIAPHNQEAGTASPGASGTSSSAPGGTPGASGTSTVGAVSRSSPHASGTGSTTRATTASSAPSASHRTSTRPEAGASPTTPKTSATPANQSGTQSTASPADQVLDLINQTRKQNGLPPYQESSKLDKSASQHNQTMADGCGLSHQCPGEPPIGTRESNVGVQWTQAGENIGEGGPIADTPQAEAQMVVNLTQQMIDEQPPDDGHRQNILSSGYTYIGISVYRDSNGTVWLTQDFANAG